MTTSERTKAIQDASASLLRMQTFDPESLRRTEELGKFASFDAAVDPAIELISIYKQIPVNGVVWLNAKLANQLKAAADADYNRFSQILKFDPNTTANATAQRDSLVADLVAAYEQSFNSVFGIISYIASQSVDFSRLSSDAHSAVQKIEDRANDLAKTLADHESEADQVLKKIRDVAAEQGVSQQAIYFKTESEEYFKEAQAWLNKVYWLTGSLGGLAIVLLILHKLPWITPSSSYETVQLAVGKILAFATLASFVLFATRNYMACKHNSVINKHRQNALLTYQALVEAAGDSANKDIVLTHAADCIFSDQPTGFSRHDASETGSNSVVSLAPNSFRPNVGGTV